MLPVRELPILPLTLDGDLDRDHNPVPPQASMTNTTTHGTSIEEAVERWCATLAARNYSTEEQRKRPADVRQFAQLADWVTLGDITRTSIEDAVEAMLTPPAAVKPKTATERLGRLRAFLTYCVDRGWMTRNPAQDIRPPKVVRGDGSRALTVDEVQRLIAAVNEHARTHPHTINRAPYYIIASVTGLRVSEMQRLRWRHVVLDAERPYLALDGDVTKNGKAVDLPILGPAIGAFAAIRPPGVGPDVPVFDVIPKRKTFDKDLERAGIPKRDERGRSASLHSLRKHLATALIEGGADIYTTKTMMRHSSIAVTEQSYVDVKVGKVAQSATTALSGGSDGKSEESFRLGPQTA